jgi:hypothetical protein
MIELIWNEWFLFICVDIYNDQSNFKYMFSLFLNFNPVSKFYKHLVKWALTEIEWSVAGTTTLDRELFTIICQNLKDVCIVFVVPAGIYEYTKETVQYTDSKEIKMMFHSILCRFLSAFLKIYWQISMCDFVFFPNVTIISILYVGLPF